MLTWRRPVGLVTVLVAAAAETALGRDDQCQKYRLGDLRSRVCDLAFWLF
jgi:hypothetical protein